MATVLVSGASVAGVSVAYWLARQGHSVTVVERHPQLRPGGQAIDVRGPALAVLDRMGLLEAVRARAIEFRGMSTVGADGAEISRDTEKTATGGLIGNPDVEVLRDDLVDVLYAATEGVEFVFGDTATAIDDSGDAVRVEFGGGSARDFDLVVGADGLHSAVRRLVFGPEDRYVKRMGMYLAVCTTRNVLDLDHWQVWYSEREPELFCGLYSARENTEARVMFGFTDPSLELDYRDTGAQWEQIERRFAAAGQFPQRLLEAARGAPELYFDESAQIVMEQWARGRVVLVGDAAHCASPLSGQGTSLALLGAHTLATELRDADGDHARGFAAYQESLQEYVLANQALAFEDSSDDATWWDRFYPVINSFQPR
ncbi:FAD-dependent monooxygenase [Mycolicibacterium sp. S2-37]|uniref:FAD-dependent monooxygenase n=1 Tax=Mycolicibacterium sp. S2-37 TaxID=2810297 RepID=UPI001A94DFC3|nr:FAD-dependent monooxygenase [Mycolicibacterium sp. S2-37]MBO0679664.1 FAD-dependent monooxygenase [Mycolicibacterium sp. S2-37]